MSTSSNLYAEKVFAEHPISMWAFDESIDYISLISETDRNLSTWTVSGGAAIPPALANPSPKEAQPFLESDRYPFVGPPVAAPFNEVVLISPILFSSSELDQSKETFTIGTYVYSSHPFTVGYEIGYQYTDTGGVQRQILRFFNSSVVDRWLFISETFRIPQIVTDFKVVIKARYSIDPGSPLAGYQFFMNGLSVGQWSENFNTYSLGIRPSTYETISTPTFSGTGLKANAYGKEDGYGYYIADQNNLYAKNFGVPLVFGSGNVTRIYPNENSKPSIVIPGNGFLNESGRFQEYTIEAWIRANPKSNNLRRIIGPLGSDDGIYINGPFVTLVIGNSSKSHYIGQWFRPILIDLKLGIDYANLFINSEEVMSLSFDTTSLDLTEIDNDWIGIFGYEDIPMLEIDVVGIYPYQVPALLLKRRLGYAQAVESPEGVNRAYGGVVAAIDYRFADYTSNYSYPSIGKWGQGIVENISVDEDSLSPPAYSDPEIILESKTFDQWLSAQNVSQDNSNSFLKFNSTVGKGYMFVDSFRLPFQSIAAIYGVFSTESLDESKTKTLIRVENQTTNSSFTISLNGENLEHRFKYWGQERSLYLKAGVSANNNFFAGINIPEVSSFFGDDIEAFFANTTQLKIYVANDQSMLSQFDGRIHKFSICTYRNYEKIKDLFDDLEVEATPFEADGAEPDTESWEYLFDGGNPSSFEVGDLLSHIGSYSVVAKSNFGTTYLDIETDSYWEDYVPLTYFGQYVDDIFGNKYYDLDFIQFNIDYPAFRIFDGSLYNTEDSMIRTYVSFQYLSTGANAPYNYFTSVEGMPKNGVVAPGDDWMHTKYEVVNGAIIYPPKDVSIEQIAIVTHIEMSVSGIKTNPISIKKIEYSSESFNDFTSNPVGTKYGVALYPYSQYASQFDYKSRNPFRIYKGSTPHLYLTEDSGINRVGDYSSVVPRGISIPVNQGSAEKYRVIAMQMFMLYNKDAFASQAIQLFEVAGAEKYLRFYIKANDRTGQRGRIYAVNARTGTTEDGIAFYINGNLVRDPVISLNEWVSIGISFATTLSFDEYPGAIRLTDTVLFNNVAYYESTSLQEIERQAKRTWSRIFTEYEDWLNLLKAALVGNFLWNDVLVTSSVSFFGISPGDIYKSYIGMNKRTAEGAEELVIGEAEIRLFSDVRWDTSVVTPV
jgi:hypothetical protein